MSNDIKHNVLRAKLLDQLRLVGVVLGLAAAAAVVPLPWELSADLASRRVTTRSDLDAVLDAVSLGAASIVVWLLLCWIMVSSVLTLAARVPGAVGTAARGALARITPAFVRRTIAVGLSVGAVAGVAAGTAPSAAGVPPSTSGVVSTTTTTNLARLLPSISHPLPSTSLAGPVAGVAAAVAAGIDRVGDRAEPSMSVGPVAEPTDGVSTQVSGTAVRGVPSPTPAGHRLLVPTAQPNSIDIDWPVHRPASAASGTPDLDWPVDPTVVVHRGDTLWSIAADRLGPGATDAQIDASWRSWYAANRAVIGDDPNLILPGQQLHAPPT